MPAIEGDGVMVMTTTGVGEITSSAWTYQSLGVVGPDDVGMVWSLDAGAGATANNPCTGDVTLSFRTSAGPVFIGDAVGTPGTLTVVSNGAIATQLAPIPTAVFIPTSEDVGKEIFAVIDVEALIHDGSGLAQYMVDSTQLTAVPEPSSLALIVLGLVGLAVSVRRRIR